MASERYIDSGSTYPMPFDCFALRAGSPQTGLPLFFSNLFQLSMKEEAKCVDTSDRFHKRRHIRLYLSILNSFFYLYPRIFDQVECELFQSNGGCLFSTPVKDSIFFLWTIAKATWTGIWAIDRPYFAFPYWCYWEKTNRQCQMILP